MKIIISPYSRQLRNGGDNAKNWPKKYWVELVKTLKEKGNHITQIGRSGEEKIDGVDDIKYDLPLVELGVLLDSCTTWISVDNFWPHFCHLHNKPGVALFAQSDPNIFGHSENVNLLKDRKYLKDRQFDIWEYCPYIEEAFVTPSEVIGALSGRFDK